MPESSAPSSPASVRDKLLSRFGKGGALLLAVMVAMLVSVVAFAIEAEKPWGRTVQKRLAKHEPLQPKEHAVIGLWWAAVVNAGMLAVLLGTAHRWMPGKAESKVSSLKSKVEIPNETSQAETLAPRPDTLDLIPHRWMLALLFGAVAFGAWERWPKLSHSYWNDEEYAIRRFAHGSWEKQKDGTVAFEPVTWTDTLFENRNGNNHLLNSLTTRVSLSLWRSATGAPREAFNEFVSRVPQFLAGLGSIAIMFFLGREVRSPLAGLGAAWLMALHPWHIRYSVEMRGYALMLFFVSLALLALSRALKTDRLRWWLVFAASEALFLLSFPGALYVAAAVNVVCAIELLRRRDWSMTGRLVAFNVLSAVPVLQWMLPSIPQLITFLREEQPAYVTDVWQWLHDLVSVLAVGWQFDNPWRDAHVGTDWKGTAAHFPLPPVAVAVILALLLVAGLVLAFRRGTPARIIVIAPVLAALVSLGMNLRPGSPMTVWYLIYLLIPAALAIPLALEKLGQWRNLRWLPTVLVAWFTIRYGMGTASAVAALRDHDRQPIRRTVAFIHAQSPEALTATFGVSDRQSSTYDPKVAILESAADLEAVIAQSRATSKPLYVYYCSDEHGEKRRPDIYTRVVKSGEFERVAGFPGSEELFSYRVYRLQAAR